MKPSTFQPFNLSTLAAFCILHSAFCIGSAFAAPNVDQNAVTLVQDSQSRLVTVSYTLTGEPAVVTVDFQTNTLANAAGNWISIGDVNFTNVVGDVNQVVQTGARVLHWQPCDTWPDQRINGNRVRAVVKAWATNAPPDWCAVCLLSDSEISTRQQSDVTFNPVRRRYFASKEAIPGGAQDRIYKTDYLLLRKIPAAGVVWMMGKSGFLDQGAYPHKVMLTKDYYIGVYEITYAQYYPIYGSVPQAFSDANGENREIHPVGRAQWSQIRGDYDTYPWPQEDGHEHEVASLSYLGLLRIRAGIDSFDLPADAQWEYACRAGSGTAHCNGGANASALNRVGWYKDNYNDGTTTAPGSNHVHPVGQKEPNAWGIYDMEGNVSELVLDWYEAHGATLFPDADAIVENPIGPANGTKKIWRGGYVWQDAFRCSCYARVTGNAPASTDTCTGLRVVCDAVAK